MAVWMVRAGEQARHARAFADNEVIALGWPNCGIGNLEQYDNYELVSRLTAAGQAAPDADAAELLAFRDQLFAGEIVVTPEEKSTILIGKVAGAYEYRDPSPVEDYRHIRAVRWLGRWDRDLLPDHVRSELRHRRTLKRLSITNAWVQLAERLEAGERMPVKARAASTSRPRAPRATAAAKSVTPPPPTDKVCAACGLRLRLTQFDRGSDTCRDCS